MDPMDIMSTVTTVEYYMLINGNPQGIICPQIGLCDPLSPYLYILCADVLSNLISSTENKGKIRGIRIGNGIPPFTHLLFADDFIFFCQANNQNCKAIKEVFEYMSFGQANQ